MTDIYFVKSNREEGEKFEKCLSRLQNQADKCNFTNKEEQLMDQITDKCALDELRKQILLLSNDDINLNKIIDKAKALENVNHYLHLCKKNIKEDKTEKRMLQMIEKKYCIRCGKNHSANYIHCPAINNTCLKCGYFGHFKKFCKTKILKEVINNENKGYVIKKPDTFLKKRKIVYNSIA